MGERTNLFTDKNGNPCFLCLNFNDDKRKLNMANEANDWNDNWWFAVVRNYYFFSRSSGVFCLKRFVDAFLPSAKHASYLVKVCGQFDVVVVGNDLRFPRDREKEFSQIKLSDCASERYDFLNGRLVCCQINMREHIQKMFVDFVSQRMAGGFWKITSKLHPEQIS